ncbi:flagellar hook-associated family protein [Pseudochelatococcus contaminans]|uniref:Flagellin n=1 Tax=Pseudochelatococcus contaminans TaxID=1538103 RepID=A0A7W6EE42_9HYPH|nr:flagellar hook-associated family protein [Pseudochelatococcus contaminans]MBB3808011.1 flagellar hook-associated protein 3 FlgL [Pseudochelatococcus contaminans]
MASNFVSTYNLLNGPRAYARSAQADITRFGKEVVEARYADVGLVLGAKTGHSTILYQELARIEGFTTSNGLASGRLDMTQAALTEIREAGEDMMATLVGLPTNDLGSATIKGEAERVLKAMTDKLNSAYAGQQLFSGIKTDTAPMTQDAGTAQVTAAFDNFKTAFQTYWTDSGKAAETGQAVATVNDIGAEELSLFLNPVDPTTIPASKGVPFIELATAVWNGARLDQEFNDANWQNWSSASNTAITSRISASETITTSISANDSSFRGLARAYSVLAVLPADEFNENAFKEVVSYAIKELGLATEGVTIVQAGLGSAQTRVKTINESLATQKTLLQKNISDLEGVDPAAAKVSLDAAELQLNLAYALTARLQSLSLLNYIK